MKDNTFTCTCLPNDQLRAQGAAILRVAAELDDFLKDEEVPESLRDDLAKMKLAGEWLVRASSINLKTLKTQGFPAAGHPASGFTVPA